MAGTSVAELVELASLLLAVGALSGFLAGVFGIGGGVFYERFRFAVEAHARRRVRVLSAAASSSACCNRDRAARWSGAE